MKGCSVVQQRRVYRLYMFRIWNSLNNGLVLVYMYILSVVFVKGGFFAIMRIIFLCIMCRGSRYDLF